MKKFRDSQYFQLGRMILILVVITVVLLAMALNFSAVAGVVSKFFDVLSPLILGCVFAYLLNPLMNFIDKRLYPLLCKKNMKEEKAYRLSRAVSVIFALLFALVLIYEFFAMLLPQLYTSIVGIVNNLSNYYTHAEEWILSILENNPDLHQRADGLLQNAFDKLELWAENDLMDWVNTKLVGNLGQIFTGLTSSVMSVVSLVVDLLIALAASIYILCSRDTFMAQAKKVTVALARQDRADRIMDIGRRIHKVFSGFIIGKILDSLIIGILCYIGMLIFKMPFPALIATVVGVTNVIPFFGPFIGAIPSAILILLVDPLQCLYFCIFILVLQQLDGNVIGPRILGDSIGISGFWVLVSITVAGGLFGFGGMLLGVPVFAVLYMLVTDYVEGKLKAKGKTVETGDYLNIQFVDDLDQQEEVPS